MKKGSKAAKAWGAKMKRLRNKSKPKRKTARRGYTIRAMTVGRKVKSRVKKRVKRRVKKSTDAWSF